MIKFPRVHIATSVTNRILDIADGIPAPTPPPDATRAPLAPGPSVAMQGAAIDAKLSQAPPSVGTVENSPDPGATLSGAPLLDTLLTPGQ